MPTMGEVQSDPTPKEKSLGKVKVTSQKWTVENSTMKSLTANLPQAIRGQ